MPSLYTRHTALGPSLKRPAERKPSTGLGLYGSSPNVEDDGHIERQLHGHLTGDRIKQLIVASDDLQQSVTPQLSEKLTYRHHFNVI